jgi:hypothetical protein
MQGRERSSLEYPSCRSSRVGEKAEHLEAYFDHFSGYIIPEHQGVGHGVEIALVAALFVNK